MAIWDDILKKLPVLADAAKYDASCASSGSRRKTPKTATGWGMGNTEGMGICHSYTPDGRCVSLLKILFTNVCVFDCAYCVNRISSEVRRASFSVEEVVALTLEFYRRNYIEGLFLSSGVKSTPDATMEKLIAIVRRLREAHGFGGYIHLKAVAGASPELCSEAGVWADRVSANIELPTDEDLSRLAPAKTHAEVETVMEKIKTRIVQGGETRKTKRKYAPGGQSTQLVVGASPSTDHTILNKSAALYSRFGLRRVYYTAYSPVPKALGVLPTAAPPLIREHRLYQADWLLRYYGFTVPELFTEKEANLELQHDPKLSWALRNRQLFPVDINRADKESLLRVPGFGVRGVERILKARRFRALRLYDLQVMRLGLSRARYFIQTQDFNPSLRHLDAKSLDLQFSSKPVQLSLFESGTAALTGEV